MNAPDAAPAPQGQPSRATLADPQHANELLMYRINRLLAVAGSLVIRLCEGGYGITRREWGLLMWLAEHPAGVPPTELARQVGLDRARTSRTLTSLLAKKLITREPAPGDKRQARVALTPAGRAVHDALLPQIKALNQGLLQGLAPEAIEALDQTLAALQARADVLVAEHADLPRTYRLRGGRRRT